MAADRGLQEKLTGSLEIVQQLYLDSRVKAVAQMLDIMSQTRSDVELTPGLTAFWQEALKELSPVQVRDGYMAFMKSERGVFKPTPADIIGHAPEATDIPRKVKDPNCPECSGSGFRTVLVDSKIHPGQKARRVTDCFCAAIEYDGKTFKIEQKQLAATPEIPADELLKRITAKTGIGIAPKGFPGRDEQSESDYRCRREELEKQRQKLAEKKA